MSSPIAVDSATESAGFCTLRRHLPPAVIALFADYELAVWASTTPNGSSALEREVAASIGFTGKQFSGSLMLRATEASIGHWLEAMGMPGSDPSDALSEYSNMLLGRIKCRLLGEGLPITLATPTATAGMGLRFSMPPAESVCLSFSGNDWSITVRFDASFEAGFEFDRAAIELAADAGECILF